MRPAARQRSEKEKLKGEKMYTCELDGFAALKPRRKTARNTKLEKLLADSIKEMRTKIRQKKRQLANAHWNGSSDEQIAARHLNAQITDMSALADKAADVLKQLRQTV